MIRHFSGFLIFISCLFFIIYTATGAPSEEGKPATEKPANFTPKVDEEKELDTKSLQAQIYRVQDSSFSIPTEPYANQLDNFDSNLVTLPSANRPQVTTLLRPAKSPAEIAPLSVVDIATGFEDVEPLAQEIARNTNLPEQYRELAQQSVYHASQSLEDTLRIFKLLNNYNPVDTAMRANLSQAYKIAFENVRQAYNKAGGALLVFFTDTSPSSVLSLSQVPTARDLISLTTKTLATFKKAYETGQKLDKSITSSIDYLIQTTLDEAKYLIQQF